MTFFIGRCRVTVGFFFLAVIALLLTLDQSGAAQTGLACAALHECAHLAAMGALGCMPREIRFTPFGIDIIKPCRTDRSYGRDVLISLAGPLANLAAAAVCFAVFRLRFPMFLLANLVLFVLNIAPVEPLDGGQALQAFLCTKMEPGRAAKMVSVISFLALVPLACAGFLILFRSKWNFSLLFVSCYLMVLLLMKRER